MTPKELVQVCREAALETQRMRNMLEVVAMVSTREQTTDDRLNFSYGSNLHMVQMSTRCPYAVPVCRARLQGWRLEFRGVLTIVEGGEEDYVDGAVWRTTAFDEKKLDRYEGFPRLYRKEDIQVAVQDLDGAVTGKEFEAYVYIMNHGRPALPSPSYLAVCLEGAEDWSIPADTFHAALDALDDED